MSEKIREGDLVRVNGIPTLEEDVCVILKGPYPAVFTFEEDGITHTEETKAADIMCAGRIISKIKCRFLTKIKSEH